MSSSLALFCLLSVKKHKHEVFFFVEFLIIIRFGFYDIQNAQGLSKSY